MSNKKKNGNSNKFFFPEITGAYPVMVNGKKTKRTTRSRQAANFNDPRGFRLPTENFGNPKISKRKLNKRS